MDQSLFRPRPSRKGVSPVPAELMLIALVVAGGVIVYFFVSGMGGTLTQGGSQGVTRQLSLDAYTFPSAGPLTLTIRNVGTVSATIQTVYFDGSPVSNPGCSGAIAPEGTTQCSFTPSPVPAYGTSNQVKIVTVSGAIFTFNVVAGQSS